MMLLSFASFFSGVCRLMVYVGSWWPFSLNHACFLPLYWMLFFSNIHALTYQEVCHLLQHVGPMQPKRLVSPRTDKVDTGLLGLKWQIVVIPGKIH